jgi:formylglycine-generating enzyme required for sulfatase activity
VARGGSWNFNPLAVRASMRFRDEPGRRGQIIGFRVARDLSDRQ